LRERERERDSEREEREKKRGEMDGCCCAAKMDGWGVFRRRNFLTWAHLKYSLE